MPIFNYHKPRVIYTFPHLVNSYTRKFHLAFLQELLLCKTDALIGAFRKTTIVIISSLFDSLPIALNIIFSLPITFFCIHNTRLIHHH